MCFKVTSDQNMMDDDELETKPKLLVTDTTPPSGGGGKEPRSSIFSSLLSNDSGFKSEHHTASSSSSSSSNSSVNNEAHQSQADLLKPQLSRSSEESVPPIMVDCHSAAAAATVASAATALAAAAVSENKEDVREIKPIPIKKTLPEFVEEEMNLAESSFRFKPTGAVFKSISHSRTSLNSSGTILLEQKR